MTAHEHSTNKSKDSSTPVIPKEEELIPDNASDISNFYAMQSTGASTPPPHTVLQLQRTLGNQAVQRLVNPAQEKNNQSKNMPAWFNSIASSQTSDTVQRREGDEAAADNFRREHADHAHLVKGISNSMMEEGLIGQLIENFFTRTDFNYDFSSKSPFKKSGDCQTLVDEFIATAKYFGITVTKESGKTGFFIPGGGKIVHSSNVTGNIDNQKHFFFETHTWGVWQGKQIDVLFGQLGVVGHMTPVTNGTDDKGMPTWTAGDFTFYLKHGATTEFDRYTSNPKLKLKL